MVLCTNQGENIYFRIILLPHPIHFKKMVTLLCLYVIHAYKFYNGRNYKFFFPAVSHVTILPPSLPSFFFADCG